ncbi:MAG: M48 family metallopeptidase [Spirochaetes bacterium]|nr:M48 family metallopeptidase [Spirochaetota bacterium]
MNILSVFLIFFFSKLILDLLLDILNLKTIAKTNEIPGFLKAHLSEEDFSKTKRYTVSKEKFSIFQTVCQAIVLLAFIFSGCFGRIEVFLVQWGLPGYIEGIIFIYIVSFILSFLMFPFSVYFEFVIEKKYGFSNMTASMFILDLVKSTLIGIIISFPLLLALFWFVDSTGSLWWIFAFIFTMIFQIVLIILYPLVIAPIFNKFEKLEEGSLTERLFALASKLDFNISGIFKMDGSKRSKHSNAYFTGLGKTKRVVLFDTLLNLLKDNELEAVLAHEIGHYKKRHLIKGIILSLAVMFCGFFVISLLLHFEPLFLAFGFTGSSTYGIITLMMLYSSCFTFFLTPLFNLFSRKNEYEADRYAVLAVENKESLKDALLKLGKDNLSNPVPHPLYSFFHYSHPVLSERLKAIEKTSTF